ncbi:hypothetical protein Pmani_027825 [Petrolisthes manimaculis]|uniref:C-type lectin domain-containing protein n=1 Tax=Petrolisthes manimaculis TaxID=1843537 RepID=A0AAE1P275_9EUCA|nr:hypothetical protein Pmani_027825 [Petrolisthes manimaculis]
MVIMVILFLVLVFGRPREAMKFTNTTPGHCLSPDHVQLSTTAVSEVELKSGFVRKGKSGYLMVRTALTHYEARQACWNLGTRMNHIKNEEETQYIKELAMGHYVWSLSDDIDQEGTWQNTDTEGRVYNDVVATSGHPQKLFWAALTSCPYVMCPTLCPIGFLPSSGILVVMV